MSGMNKVLEIHGEWSRWLLGQILMYLEADSDVIVQSGVKWEDLNRALAEKGIPLFFPVCIVACGVGR
jgi:D-lactate dehydrogenase (cytochrome)